MKPNLRKPWGIVLSVAMLLTGTLFAQTPFLHWAKMARNSGGDVLAMSMAIDPTGYVYVVGGFTGTVDFNPGAGTFNLTSGGGGFNGYVQKLDTNGNFIWAVSFSGASDGQANAVSLDNAGNIYVSGHFMGLTDFNPGVATANLTPTGFVDQFVVKLTSSGTYVWANRTGASSFDYTIPTDNLIDASGNLYTVGWFMGTVDFNPGAPLLNLSSAGFYDAYVQKLDASGNFLWARKWGGSNADQSIEVNIDPLTGNLVITGVLCSSTADFDPGAGVFNLGASPGSTQACFIQRLTPAGAFVSAAKFDGGDGVVIASSTVDAGGNLIIGGTFGGTVDFDPGAGVTSFSRPSFPGYDGFLMKLNSANVLQWAYHFPITDWMDEASVETDLYDNIYFSGDFQGAVDFDPGAGTVNRSTGGYNSFVLKLTPSAGFTWLATTENNAEAFAYHMELDPNLNVYVCGDFNGNEDFDPQGTTFNMNATGTPYAQFVYKLRQVGPFILPEALTLQGSPASGHVALSWHGNTSATSGTYEVLRSEDGISFATIGWQQPDPSRSTQTFMDEEVTAGGSYLYQVRISDVNGTVTHSNQVKVVMPAENALSAWPNPCKGVLTLRSSDPLHAGTLVNALGQTVMVFDAEGALEWQMDFSSLDPGLYLLYTGGQSLAIFHQ